MSRPSHRRAVVLALVVTVLWSSSWVLIRRGLDQEGLDPLTFAGLRYTVAAGVLWLWVAIRGDVRRTLRGVGAAGWRRLMLLGLVMYALTQGAQFVAIDNQPAATTSLVLSLTPLVVAAASTVATGEPPSIRQTTGAGLVAGGAILYFVGDLGATTVGMAAALTGLASNAWASLLGRRVNRASDLPSAVVTTIGMTLGGALLLAAGAVSGGSLPVSGRSWALIGWLAVVNTALAFTMWNRSLRRLTALESAGINNTMLIQIAALGWIFLDEAPGPAALAGVIVVSAGVLMTQAAGAPRSRRA